ncbi:hypothetical protein Bphy_5710 (plasmid) [Paraburkholderia phymatum STM815]|uniref:Uncharacterized protein n=1 Tax=Paraburkholderia phymatum (strain DSM 17167 / CIP 108236 / LMG 21445 / STM815) TaxID=391038 RepID=B2JV04_PARP8|nr:hypothetical protein Bphy_5710 [Paraburkholderia phymatum STM815]
MWCAYSALTVSDDAFAAVPMAGTQTPRLLGDDRGRSASDGALRSHASFPAPCAPASKFSNGSFGFFHPCASLAVLDCQAHQPVCSMLSILSCSTRDSWLFSNSGARREAWRAHACAIRS